MTQVAIIGLGRFGSNLATNLSRLGADVVAIDREEENVEAIIDRVSSAVMIDCTVEQELISAGIGDVDIAVVAIGEDAQMCILITAILRRLGIPRIIARATSSIQAEILGEVGAHKIIYMEEQYAELLARDIVSETTLEHIPIQPDHHLIEISPPDNLVGKTLREAGFPRKHNVGVVAIFHHEQDLGNSGETISRTRVEEFPPEDAVIGHQDTLLIFGKTGNCDKLKL